MARMNYKVSHSRGANLIAANPQRMESADGSRWATGRNVKVSTGWRTYGAVEVWVLKTRDEEGRAIVVHAGESRAHATAWVEGVDCACDDCVARRNLAATPTQGGKEP